MKNTKLVLNLAEKPVRIDLDLYTSDRAYELFEKVAQIRIKNSPYAKYPKQPGEGDTEWRERLRIEAEKEQIRGEEESEKAYLERVFNAKNEQFMLAKEILCSICEVFGLEQPSEARFKSGNWIATKRFIYDVLSLGDIACGDFYVEEIGKNA